MNDEKIFEEKLKNIFKNYEKIFLIQIGANDGIMADPLYNLLQTDSRIYAFLLEPQKEVFSILKKNYDNIKERITFLNVAIGKENGNVKLYKNIDPLGSSGHASLLLRQNEYACNFDENSYEIVESVTVANLLKDNKSEIDILVIDTEGYDIEIIKQFIEENALPKVIFFERPYPLPGNDRLNNVETGNSVLEEIINKLEKLDYNVEVLSRNVICIKNMTFSELFKTEYYDKMKTPGHPNNPVRNRADSFLKIFQLLEEKKDKNFYIVETGTTRADFGHLAFGDDGASTYIFDHFINYYDGEVNSVDIKQENVRHCRSIVTNNTKVFCSDSVKFLWNLPKDRKIDFLYLDSYDIELGNPHPSMLHHFKELCAAIDKLQKGSIVVVDDHNAFPYIPDAKIGKGNYVKEFMDNIGATLLFEDYQIGWVL